jgi:DNA-directed RNA polymerase subunit RPC12/RpoP
MSFFRNLFGGRFNQKRSAISPEKVYVICPACGAGYNTEMVMSSILLSSPFMEDMASWSTRVTCKNCSSQIVVNGSYNKTFGQPRPG